jgi:capsular polysaccharide biosynthesis protein
VISISSDKKSGAITISAEHPNRFLTKNLVDIYLKEATSHLRKVDLIDTQKQIDYYERELAKTTNIELREQLSKLVSGLIQKKVLSEASEYYIVKKITDSRVAFVKDKIKPKRALILVVAFVTSIILGIFGVFFMEFLRNNKDEENIEEVIKK